MALGFTKLGNKLGALAEPSEKSVVKDVRDLFEMQYRFTSPFLDEFNRVLQLYDQVVDPDRWETNAEITLGLSYAIAQNLIAPIMYYTLWAPEVPFELIPRDSNTTYDTARRVRENLVYTQRERMDLENQGYRTLLMGLKCGVGYTLVEPRAVTEPGFGESLAASGDVVERMVSLGVGNTVDVTSSRYMPVGRVFPTPDGSEPNGPQAVSAVSVLDYVTEHEFLRGFTRPNSPFKGGEKRAKEIIAYAKAHKINSWTGTARQLADYLANRPLSVTGQMNDSSKNMPALIPILKQYRQNRHIWLAVDKFIIYDIEDTFQTLQCPLAKATMSPEGDQWFTKGAVGRSYDVVAGLEAWVNSMFDMLSLSLHPHKIINKSSMLEEDQQDDIEAYGVSRCVGDPRLAMHFPDAPQLPSQAFAIPEMMRNFASETVGGGPSAQSSGTPGLVRGGSGALESLLQTSTGREKSIAKSYENGWYKQMCMLTLIHQQILNTDSDAFTRVLTAGPETAGMTPGEKYFAVASVTNQEIRQHYRFEFNFREKLRNFLAESSHRVQVFAALKDNPKVNPEENVRQLVGDEYLANRLLTGFDQEERMADLMRLATAGQGGGGARPNPITAGRGVGVVSG